MIRIATVLRIRPGEGVVVALLCGIFASVEAGRALGDIGADTIVVSRLGVDVLPWLLIALGVAAVAASLVYGAAVGKLRRGPLFAAIFSGSAAVLVALRLLMLVTGEWLVLLVWLAVNIVATLVVSVNWGLAGAVLDTRQAKRLFPIVTSAAIVGSFAGTLGAGPAARLAGAENLVVLDGGFMLVASLLTARVVAGRPALARRGSGSIVGQLRVGFDYVRGSRLMRLVAAAYVLLSVLYFVVGISFLRAASEAITGEPELAGFLGLVSAAVTATSLVLSLFLASRIYARIGVAGAALALPIVYVAGFAVWLGSFSLVTATGLRFAKLVTARGLTNAAYSALFNVVPPERRPQVVAFNDGVPGQLGTMLSGAILVLVSSYLEERWLFLLGLGSAIAALVLAWSMRREYGRALMATLRAGLGPQLLDAGPGLDTHAGDPQARAVLLAGLADARPPVRCLSAELAARVGDREAVAPLIGLLDDPDATVRRSAVTALGDLGDSRAADPIRRMLSDADASVRAAAVDAVTGLTGAGGAGGGDGIRPGGSGGSGGSAGTGVAGMAGGPMGLPLDDPDPRVRLRVVVALTRAVRAGAHGIDPVVVRGSLQRSIESPDPDERALALGAVAELRGVSPPVRLAAYLSDPSPTVRAAAATVIGDADDAASAPELVEAFDADDARLRLAAARALGKLGGPSVRLALDTLHEGSAHAQEAALIALEGHGDVLRDGLVAWSLDRIKRATRLRAAAGALRRARVDGDAPIDGVGIPAGRYLVELLAERQWEIESLILRCLGLLGAPEAGGLIRRALTAGDPETRAQALEALDTVADRRVAGALVALLDADSTAGPADASAVLADLARDPDPWIRALSVRTQRDRLSGEWRRLRELAAADSAGVVRDALADLEGGDMSETRQTLTPMDRILFLRGVPIFSGLAPEDVHRIAETATERLYPRTEVIFREGDLGEELLVIVDGRVTVRKGAPGQERSLGSYGAGEYIGELAVLRKQPRAASVIAEDDVRVLVIGGGMLRAVLLERPDAAMAMLASLAERVSSQG